MSLPWEFHPHVPLAAAIWFNFPKNHLQGLQMNSFLCLVFFTQVASQPSACSDGQKSL